MDEKDAYELVEILIKIGIQEIDILGGEPFLVPWIKDFVRYVTDSHITLNISTNGSFTYFIDDFAGIHNNLLNIGFSVHGFSETHNALTKSDNFLKAITVIKRLIDSGKNPVVKSVLMQENKNELYDFIPYIGELGVKRYYLLHEDIIGRKKYSDCFSFPEFWEFYSQLKEDLKDVLDIGLVAASGFFNNRIETYGRCDAGKTKVAIMPDGSAFPCNLFSGFQEFCLGNILKDGMEAIVRNPILDRFRNCDKNRCKIVSCKHYSVCTGGCPAHSYFFYGSIDDADPRCMMKNHP
jgi:radical SAM protein with 4Fe4S-binding SPASM domain